MLQERWRGIGTDAGLREATEAVVSVRLAAGRLGRFVQARREIVHEAVRWSRHLGIE